jgi:hypothetical protein
MARITCSTGNTRNAKRGDPAYDLAIVTRGVKQPLQIAGRASTACSTRIVHTAAGDLCQQVLCLIAGWPRAALMGEGPPALDRVRSLLRRLR